MNYFYKKTTKMFFILILANVSHTHAQVKITNSTNSLINADAILHLESQNNDKGFLLVRVALTSTDSFSPLSSHERGIVVYNIATTSVPLGVTPGLYYNDGTKWIRLSKSEIQFGDIKNSYQSTDHNGWYLLDGRATTTLSSTAKAVASGLNFTTSLPNASDQLLKNKTGSQNLATLSGVNTFTLTQANLPNINFTGTTNVTGDHTHTYLDNPVTTQTASLGTNNPLLGTTEVTRSTDSSGNHNHTFSLPLGGSSTPVDLKPRSLVTNIFIYLGN